MQIKVNIIFLKFLSLLIKYIDKIANNIAKVYPLAVYGYIKVSDNVGVTTINILVKIFK